MSSLYLSRQSAEERKELIQKLHQALRIPEQTGH